MADTKFTFQRYEKKYLLSSEKYAALRAALEGYIEPDRFYQSTVCSIYYDTDNFELIRHSIEKPVYKEKLRLRSYNVPSADDPVFIELKKKFKGIVYKRRVSMPASLAPDYLAGKIPAPEDTQIFREIDWVLKSYELRPRVFIACDRSAFVSREDSELRITFDENLRWRETELDLMCGSRGEALTEPGFVLMEIKIPGSAPMWLARLLSELEIFPTGFSKYGTCYKQNLIEKYFDGVITCV